MTTAQAENERLNAEAVPKWLPPTTAISLIEFRATEALENTNHDEPWGENYFAIKNALSDILSIIREIRS